MRLLYATNRTPNTDNLNLEAAGIKRDARSNEFIKITTVGDLRGARCGKTINFYTDFAFSRTFTTKHTEINYWPIKCTPIHRLGNINRIDPSGTVQ